MHYGKGFQPPMTLGVEEGRLEVSLIGLSKECHPWLSKECHLFSAGFVGKKNLFRYLLRNAIFSRRDLSEKRTYFGICYVNERSGTLS